MSLGVIGFDDRLSELLVDGLLFELGEVEAVEGCVVPEVGLVDLLVVQALVVERRHAQVCLRWVHLPAGLQVLVAGNDVALQHPLVKEHGAKRLGDYDVDLFGEGRIVEVFDTALHDLDLPITLSQLPDVQYDRACSAPPASGQRSPHCLPPPQSPASPPPLPRKARGSRCRPPRPSPLCP